MAIGCQIASPCLVLVITARFARVRRSETRHGLCLPACIAYQDHQHHYATVPRPVWRSDAVPKLLFPFGCTEDIVSLWLHVPKILFPFGCTEDIVSLWLHVPKILFPFGCTEDIVSLWLHVPKIFFPFGCTEDIVSLWLHVPKIFFPFGCTEANGLVGFSVACSVACLAASLFSVWLGSYSVGYLVTSFALWLVSTCLVG